MRRSIILLISSLCLCELNGFAQTVSCGNTGQNTPPPCGGAGANPIHTLKANLHRAVVDLETFGPAPVTFARYYNSRTTSFNTNYWDLGAQQTWQHNWNYEVRQLSTKTFNHFDVKVRYPDGREYNFRATDSTGQVRTPDADNGDRLYEWTSGSTVFRTLVTPDGWEYDFRRYSSPRHRLEQVRNGQGLSWTITHSEDSRIRRVTNNFGRWLEIDRDTAHGFPRITAVRSSDGRQVNYSYVDWVDGNSTNSVLSAVTYPDGSQAQYTYVGAQSLTNGRPLLATARDPRFEPKAGARVKWVYNYEAIFDFGNGPYLVTGTVKEERNLDTNELIISLPDGGGEDPPIFEGDGTQLVRRYNEFGQLIEKRDGEGRPTFYSYDNNGAGYLASVTDGIGATTSYVRDFAGRVLHEIDALGGTNSLTYNSEGWLVSRTDKLGRVTTITRDTNNLPVRVDYPDGSFEEWTYNQYGQPLTHRGRNGGVETFRFYAAGESGGMPGDLKTKTDALGNTTTFTHHPNGLIASITDARGNVTAYEYNWRGQLVAITHPDGSTQTTEYDEFGNHVRLVDELGRETVLSYDEYNRVRSVQDALGRASTYEYGRAPACSACAFETTVSRFVEPGGKAIEYTYDRSGKRLTETRGAGTSTAATTSYSYDNAGRLKAQTDANTNTHVWVYDPLGRVVGETNALGQAATYVYDAVGNLLNRTDGAGIVTFWEYDDMNRITATGSGGLRYEYGYDSGGRRTSMVTRVNGIITDTTTYTYDLADRLVSKIDSTGHVLTYSYDSVGNRTNLSVGSVLSQSYAYDTRNRVSTITGNGRSTTFSYDAAGRLVAQMLPNGTTVTNTFDDANQLVSRVHKRADASAIASFAYGYDLSGNRTNVLTGEGVTSYAYDDHNRLITATYPDGRTQEFSYDPVGNRTGLNDSVHGVTTYEYGAGNRLFSSISATETNTYTYDGAGRLLGQLVNGQSRSYTYSFRSQTTSLTDTNGNEFAYEFDGDGNRTQQAGGGCLATRHVYDGPNVVLDLNASNKVTRAYVNGLGIDELIERIDFLNGEQRARYVYHTDGLHSVVAITDAAQTVVKTYSYEAFGKIRAETGSLVDRYTFTGREAIGSSEGLYYLRTRLMNPNTGRFTSEDVIGFAEGPNTYSYVGNNPTGLVDPWGMQMWGPPVNGFPQPCTGCTGNTAVNVPPVPLPPPPPPPPPPPSPPGPIGGNICSTCVGNNAAPPFPPPCI